MSPPFYCDRKENGTENSSRASLVFEEVWVCVYQWSWYQKLYTSAEFCGFLFCTSTIWTRDQSFLKETSSCPGSGAAVWRRKSGTKEVEERDGGVAATLLLAPVVKNLASISPDWPLVRCTSHRPELHLDSRDRQTSCLEHVPVLDLWLHLLLLRLIAGMLLWLRQLSLHLRRLLLLWPKR